MCGATSDQVDAAAMYEAMGRPGQRFVPVRWVDNQAELMRHRARELLAGQRTAALNALRGHLAEISLVAPQGAQHAYGLKRMAADGFNEEWRDRGPRLRARRAWSACRSDRRARRGDRSDRQRACGVGQGGRDGQAVDDHSRRRPGHRIGDHGHDPGRQRLASGREFAAFLGLTPRQNSTGGNRRLGRITKMGDRYLRKLLVVGSCATLRHRLGPSDASRLWASGMLERKTVKYNFNLTAALASKVARIVFVLMTRGGRYDGRPVAA